MRVCVACDNWVNPNKREEPAWLSARGLCPRCQVDKGRVTSAKRRKAYGERITENANRSTAC